MKKGKAGAVLPNVKDRKDWLPLVKSILLREVTPRQQEVLRLLYIEGLSVSTCAEKLSVYPSTVSRTRDRGLLRLRRFLRSGLERQNLEGEY